MKKSVLHTLVILLLLAVSVGFGFLFDFICTKIEYREYPEGYSDIVGACADECGIPKAVIYAVIKTESDFNASLASPDGAVGLMQITPEVYAEICTIMPGNPTTDPAVLYDPANNIRSGAFWLRHLYVKYGSWDTALAAYSAGTDAVDTWLRDDSLTDENGYLVKIPDTDTTEFVQAVNKARVLYERLYPQK